MWSMLIVSMCLLRQVHCAKIIGISTLITQVNEASKKGSYRGGTDLYIRADFESGDPSVYSVLVGGKSCAIVHFDSDESNIHCIVPPSDTDFPSTVPIAITSTVESITMDTSITATFSYDYERTPWIFYVNPSEACPGDEIAFVGRWGTTDWGKIKEAKVAKQQLSIIDDDEILDYWGWHNVSAVINDNVHDDKDATIHLSGGYGKSNTIWLGKQFDLQGNSYNFRTSAKIEEVSHNEGSKAGGLDLTLTGAGFILDGSKYDIKVDGKTCEVTSVTYSTLNCETSSNPSPTASGSSVFPGGAGLVREYWESTEAITSLIGSTFPSQVSVILTPQLKLNEADNTRTRLFGLFMAPETGSYKFYISSDDSAIVYLSTDNTPANKQAIITFSSWADLKDKFRNSALVSLPITLQKGSAYYLEVHHNQGTGSAHFELGVEMPGSGTNKAPFIQRVQVGPSTLVREVQKIKIGGFALPTGGSLVLKYGTTTLDAVSWDSASSSWKCSDIVSVLARSSIGSFLCSLTADSTSLSYSLTFNFAKTTARKIFAVDTSQIVPAGTPYATTKTAGSLPIEGTFSVSYKGVSSGPITLTSWIRYIERDINVKLSNINANLFLKGKIGGDGLDLYFILPSDLAGTGSNEFTIDFSTLTGGAVEGSANTNDVTLLSSEKLSVPGTNVFHQVIPSEFLRTYHTDPQIVVSINDRLVPCRANCKFLYKSPPDYPEITAVSEDAANDEVTFTGTLLDKDIPNTSIYIGYATCGIKTSSATSITCYIPRGSAASVAVAGAWTPIVHIKDQGIVVSQDSTQVTIPLVISSISPSTGSERGGTVLTITGKGFLNSLENTAVTQTVQIGTSTCVVSSSSATSITCTTSLKTTDSTLTITIGTASQTSSLFTYQTASTPTVTTLNVNKASTIVKTAVEITGTGFGTDKSKVAVLLNNADLGTYDCLVTDVTDTLVKCNVNGGPRGTYTLSVYVNPVGYALFNGASSSFDLVLKITSISPKSGSLNGETLLTVNGEGFSTDKLLMIAFIGTQENSCTIQSTTSTSFTCLTLDAGTNDLDTDLEFVLYGRLTDRATCEASGSGCVFAWSASSTPEVSGLSSDKGKAQDSITISGSGFGTDSSVVEVWFGDEKAVIASINDAEITVNVPYVLETTLDVDVIVGGKGLATSSAVFTNNVNIEDVSPKEISKGGSIVTIKGSGFYETMTVSFESIACSLIDVKKNEVTCKLPSYTTDENIKSLVIGAFTCPDSAICGISFKAAKTFSITGKSGYLVIDGTYPASASSADTIVKLVSDTAEYSCPVTSLSTTALGCTPNAPAGRYTLSVFISNFGFATGIVSYTLSLTATSASAPSSSYAGGQTLTISGTCLHESSIVRVCGSICPITSATGSTIQCTLPPLSTTYSVSTFGLKSSSKLNYFTIISSLATLQQKAFDGDITSLYQDSTNTDDFIGIDVEDGWKFKLDKIKFIGGGITRSNYKDLVGTWLQGSNDGTTWSDIKKFITINNYWNSWSVKPGFEIKYRFFRLFKAAASATWIINDVEFYGLRYRDSSSIDQTCSVLVYPSTSSAPVAPTGTINYLSSLTAVVSSISPEIGTTAGNVQVKFAGTGFGTTAADVSVTIDEVPCVINTVVDTLITCTTGARPAYTEKSLEIFINNKGLASTQGKLFTYAERWSDTNTWGGEVPPRAGESVYIPAGMNLILDKPTPKLQAILVEGSLIVEDVPGITIDSHYIFVHGGHFQIGTEQTPFLNDITITMHGNRLSPSLPNYGNKFIGVRNGILDIHGDPRTPTWSILYETASKGATSIKLQDSVDWKAGETIVLATTSYSLEESETAVIDRVDSNSANIIYLTAPLKYTHYAKTETYGSDTIEIRGEVGLLSRNIKIRGSDEGLDEQHGVHIMLFSPGDESVIGRVENLELFNAGQAFSLGRYPLHFHMIGTVSQSYIRNNAIHHTFNRATTVHGVYYLTIKNNVAFHTMGHTYFIEDGIESQNTIEHNLGINTYQSFSLLNLDQTPAVFWITNPTNFILNNHAAGGMAYGFWYSLDPHPTGPSATDTVWPEYMELGQFEDNTAHSLAKYGLRIFHKFLPSVSPGNPIADKTKRDWWDVPNVPVPAEFKRLTAWKCKRDGAIAEDIGDVRFIDFKVADNIFAGIELTYTHWTRWYQTTRVVNALIIGDSENTEKACAGTIGLLTPQTDGLFVDGAKFYNFDDTMHPMGDGSHSFKKPTRDHGARQVKLQKLAFGNSHKKIQWGYPATGFWEILDDSLTGQIGFVSSYWPHLLNPDCTDQRGVYNGIVCTGSNKIRRVGFYELDKMEVFNFLPMKIQRESGTDIPTETVTNADGSQSTVKSWSSIDMQKGGKNHKDPDRAWHAPFVTGFQYRVHWGNSPVDWTGIKIEQSLFEGAEWVHLNLNFTDRRENFVVSRGVLPAGVLSSDAGFVDVRLTTRKATALAGTDPSGTFAWNNLTADSSFEVIINGVQGNDNQWGDIAVTPYRCFGTHCTTVSVIDDSNVEKTEMFWSDPKSWASGVLPVAGQYIEIPSSWHMYLDIDTPVLQKIEINGILEFSPNKSASLHAHWVFVRKGELRSGSETSPTKKDLDHQVVLYGEPLDDSFAFNPDVQGGNKVIVVTGNISLHGYPKKSVSWLEQNTYPGDSIIFVTGVDWEVGDRIAISPSGFIASEYESFNILEVTSPVANFDQKAKGEVLTETDFSSDAAWIAANQFRQYGKSKSYLDPNQQAETASSTGITKIKLDKPIDYYHSGARLSINGYQVDMRTEIALLSRNVRITTEQNGWTGSVLVNDYLDELVDGDPVFRTGRADLTHVAFDQCGQLDTNLACVRFQSVGEKDSSVDNCVFDQPQTWAIYLNKAKNINISNNVIYNARWRAVVAHEIDDVVIHNNMVINVFQRNYAEAIMDSSAGFFICSTHSPACTFRITENKVLGFDFTGFIMSGGECGNSDVFSSGNKVRSGATGFLYTNNGAFDCMELSNNIAHFCSEGIGFKSSSIEFHLSNFEFVENLRGMGIRTARGDDKSVIKAYVSDSVFIGRTIHSLCLNCWDDLDCKQKLGYLFGGSDIGFSDISFVSKIKLPLYKAQTEATAYGAQYVDKVKFMNFNKNSKCKSNDYAISSNDHSSDYQLPQFLSNLEFSNVAQDNRIFMQDPDPAWLNSDDCVDWNCTGPLNALAFDTDGSIVGGNGGYILPNNPGIAKADICELNPTMNAYLCVADSSDKNKYMMLIFESLDADKELRTFAPINVTSSGTSFVSEMGGFRNDIAQFQDHTWDGFYTGHIRLSRFPGIVYSGQYYNISSRGTLPNSLEFRLEVTQDSNLPIIVAIRYKDPAAVNLYIDDVLVPGIKWSKGVIAECQLTDDHGTNRWFHEENTIQFVLRSQVAVRITKTSAVKINLELDINIDDFFNNNGQISFLDKFAAMLNIPSYRIRIVNIRQGSTIVDMYIVADDSLDSSTDQSNELTTVHDSFKESASSGELAEETGYNVLSYSSSVEKVKDVSEETDDSSDSNNGGGESDTNESNDDSTDQTDPNGGNIGSGSSTSNKFKVIADDWLVAVFGAIIFFLIILSGLVLYTKNANKSVSLYDMQSKFTSKVGDMGEPGAKGAWNPNITPNEERKIDI